MNIPGLSEQFSQLYGKGDIRLFHSPGRVNLIGEHIDYNGGFVLPCALDLGTYACVRKRNDKKVNLASTNFDLKVMLDLGNIQYNEADNWANYPKGVIKAMLDMGCNISGMDILISGDIPNSAGLSSSASLEVLVAVIINLMFNGGKMDTIDLVKLCQKVENEFIGVNCGIMDQFAVGMGKRDKAILLDCNSLKYSYADVRLGKYSLIIMNTNKKRALNESKYNERRMECETALECLKAGKDIKALCELSVEEFRRFEGLITNEVARKRAKHAVYENERVKKAYECLNENRLKEFGQLMVESHCSLRDLFEVTGIELDTIVEEALKVEGCIGARMTGAGFGGCAIALVETVCADEFIKKVCENYTRKLGVKPDFYICTIGEGTREIT